MDGRAERTLSIIMPAYNEERTIRECVRRVVEQPLPLRKEIVIVDDASTDETPKILASLEAEALGVPLRVLRHATNRGKGAAIRTGREAVTGDFVIIQDADLEYSPSDFPKVLAPLLDRRADAVYGSRFIGEAHRVLYHRHYLGNKLVTFLSNLLSNYNLTDMECCYKAFRADLFKGLRLTSDRFGFEPEATAELARKGARLYEVAISYHGRDYGEGKKITWRDGVAALGVILRCRLLRGRYDRLDAEAERGA